MNNEPFIPLFKKAASLIISFMILLNVFSVVLINNAENIELSNRYAKDTITKYCSIAVLLPMKIVSSFFKTNTSSSIGTPVPVQASNKSKKSKKDNTKEFFQSAVVEDDVSSIQFFKNPSPAVLTNFQNNFNNKKDVLFVISFLLLFVVLFRGNMIFARGDTEDIIIKKNIDKLVRLV